MKTVTFDDQAYELLRQAKLSPKESFSQVVKRALSSQPSLAASFGSWSDKSQADIARLRKESVEAFGWTKP